VTSDDSVATLHDYLRVLKRRKWIVITAVVLAPLAAILLSNRGPRPYEASAQVLVNRQNLPGSLSGVNDPTQLDSTRVLATQAQFARLPAVAGAALRSAGLRDRSPSDLLGASRVAASPTSDYLTFTVEDASPVEAARLATAYAQGYAAQWRRYQAGQLAAAQHGIRQRLHALAAAGSTNSTLYQSLQEKNDELVAMEAVAASTPALVRPAAGAGQVASNLERNIVFALVLALVTGIGLAFLRDALDQRARSAREIEDHLQLRVLGRLPRPPRALRGKRQLVMLADPTSAYAEQFRMLRTTLEFARGAGSSDRHSGVESHVSLRPAYRLMVTSGIEGEGKSTTVANLAVAFAHAGRKVVLVDLDFRRASLHRLFGVNVGPGFTDVLNGSVSLPSVVSAISVDIGNSEDALPAADRRGPPNTPPPASHLYRVGVDGFAGALGFVPIGNLPLRSDTVGMGLGIPELFDRLSADADLLLIDSPPLLRVGDALSLTSHVDGLLVVASLRTMQTPMLNELRRVLDESPAAKLGFVLTGADSEGGYGYLSYRYHRQVPKTG
jgi:succinoglycan biosynthesis transport protein ExoP